MRLVLALFVALLNLVLTDAALSPLRHLMSVNHRIVFTQDPVPSGVDATRYYPMRLRNGTSFVCVLPHEAHHLQEKLSAQFEKNSLVSTNVSSDIHEAFRGLCFRMMEGWWTYILCWNDRVEQLHFALTLSGDGKHIAVDSDSSLSHFSLGVAPPEKSIRFRYGIDDLDNVYIYTRYKNGDVCDITRMPRATEVRLYCAQDGEEKQLMIRETEACQYVATLTLKRTCAFGLRRKLTNSVTTCHRLYA